MKPYWDCEQGARSIGSILDAWDLMPNDQRQQIEDEHSSLARNLNMLARLRDDDRGAPVEYKCPVCDELLGHKFNCSLNLGS